MLEVFRGIKNKPTSLKKNIKQRAKKEKILYQEENVDRFRI
jgi:hypothetical protein